MFLCDLGLVWKSPWRAKICACRDVNGLVIRHASDVGGVSRWPGSGCSNGVERPSRRFLQASFMFCSIAAGCFHCMYEKQSLRLSHKRRTGVGANFFPVGGAAACCCPKQTVPCCCAARSLGYTRCEDAPGSSVSARHSVGANASFACERGTRALWGRRQASVYNIPGTLH